MQRNAMRGSVLGKPHATTVGSTAARPGPDVIFPGANMRPAASLLGNRSLFVKQSDPCFDRETMKGSPERSPMDDWDPVLNEFMSECRRLPFELAIEQVLKKFFTAREVLYWQNVPSLGSYWSPKTGLTTPVTGGLVAFGGSAAAPVKLTNPTGHPTYSSPVDGQVIPFNSTVLLFGVKSATGLVLGVVEVIRSGDFLDAEVKFADWFSRKMGLMSQWIMTPNDADTLTSDIALILKNGDGKQEVFQKVSGVFGCRAVEVWKFNKGMENAEKYTATGKDTVVLSSVGLVLGALQRAEMVNVMNCKLAGNYNAKNDGNQEEPVIAVPVKEGGIVMAVVLRGCGSAVYGTSDCARLQKAVPHILLSVEEKSGGATPAPAPVVAQPAPVAAAPAAGNGGGESMSALLEFATAMSSQTGADKLPQLVMEKGKEVTHADRATLFMFNEAKDKLVSHIQVGLQESIEIAVTSGIAGKVVSQKKLMNVADVSKEGSFDASVDKKTGYKTKSVLCVPIFNSNGDVIGCVEMLNKDSGAFTDDDVKVIQVFNIVAGVALENGRLVKAQGQLHSVFDAAVTVTQGKESVQVMVTDIMEAAKGAISADRASFFTYDEGKKLLLALIANGDKVPETMPLTKGLIVKVVTTKEAVIENDCYTNPDFNKEIDEKTGYKTKSILAVPVFSTEGTLVGVVELLNKKDGDFTPNDRDVLNTFATLAALAVQNSSLKEAVEKGSVEVEMQKWMSASERQAHDVPQALMLTDEERATVESMAMFAGDFKGIGHFKECFYFFKMFNFFELFKITGEQLFKFIAAVSERYTDTSYHNWTHACDVTQCIVFQMKVGNIDERYEAWELFTLVTASICHDTNHQGFNNVFNVKAETPLGILFKDTSVMETHHVAQAIPIIERSDIQLFGAFDAVDSRKVWTLFIRLILATDMAMHFELVKQAQTAADEGFDFTDPDQRLLGLRLLLKVADISNVSRPFEIADKWCDILNVEFFRQGDLEEESGIGYTSPLNNRSNSNKPKSQIGFYNFICLPLYSVVAKLYPSLQVNVDQVQSNLEKWKELVAAQEAQG